ncbi:MAG: hypothetical protein OYH77_02270 [Pseudomonadota bacterium]|nr:hypothetical protein [Pseudomonadota bacterium]
MPLTSASSPRNVYPIGDGYHLKNSVLSLDVSGEADLSFVSSALMPMPEGRRIIATEDTAAIFAALHRKKINALVCQYQRPFSVGELTLELLPSGTVLGGASLFIQTTKHSVLYAPHLQTEAVASNEPMTLRKADILVIGIHHGNFVLPKRTHEVQRLASAIAASDQQLYVYCEAIGTAQEVCVLAARLGCSVAMHASIAAISKVYKPNRVADYRLYRRTSAYDVVILPYSHIKYQHRHAGVSFYVHDTSPAPQQRRAEAEFTISRFSAGAQLRAVVSQVNPSEVYIVGDYARTHYDKIKADRTQVQPVFAEHQPTLF